MKPVRIAVVGVGSLGQHHARKLAESPGVVLAGVADPNEVAGRQVAMQHGVEWCASFQQLPAGLDGVIIASPTIYHAEAATYFLQQGIATFVEKPLAPSAEQAESLWRLAAEHDALLQVGHIERFNPAFELVQERVETPLYIRAQRVAPYTFRSTDIGVVHDLMIHDIDLVLALTGEMPVSTEAFGAVGVGPHEDMAVARLRMESGTVVDITSSRMSPVVERSLQVWGVSGCVQADLQTRKVTHWKPAAQVQSNPGMIAAIAAATADPRTLKDRVFGEWIQGEELQGDERDALSAEIQDFVESIRGMHAPRVGGREGVNALNVAAQVLNCLELWSWQASDNEAAREQRKAA